MEDLRIDIFMHVGGVMKFGRVVRYVGGESLKFGAVDMDKIAYFTLVRLAEASGYASERLWYVLPKHSLSAGLRMIRSDKDVNEMVSAALVTGHVNVYVEGHQNASADRIENDADVIGSDRQDRKVQGSDIGSEGDSVEVPCCIIDSPSNETSYDQIGAAIPIGMNGQAQMKVEHQVAVNKDLGQNSECRDSSDKVKTGDWDEEVTKKRSRSPASIRFDPKCDPRDLVFTVGLTFDDVGQLKEAVRVHAAYNRADVRFVRSSSNSLEAKCVDGCPWRVHASCQRSKSEFVVKRSELEHKCVNPRTHECVLQPSNVGKMWPESKGEGPVKPPPLSPGLNEAKQNTKDEVSELKKPEKSCEQCFHKSHNKSTCQDAPAPQRASQPADSKDGMISAEPIQVPSGQARLFGLRKKSEVRRGGMHSNISRQGRV